MSEETMRPLAAPSLTTVPLVDPIHDVLHQDGFSWHPSGVLCCERCGALVSPRHHLRHIAFHQAAMGGA